MAALATPVMLFAISELPLAVSEILRAISLVVAVCSSTAVAIVFWISLMRAITPVMLSIASTAPLASFLIASTFPPKSTVSFAVALASSFTSLATTAKSSTGLPSARGLPMVALSAKRLVCSAIEVISLMTFPISATAFAELGHGGGGGAS